MPLCVWLPRRGWPPAGRGRWCGSGWRLLSEKNRCARHGRHHGREFIEVPASSVDIHETNSSLDILVQKLLKHTSTSIEVMVEELIPWNTFTICRGRNHQQPPAADAGWRLAESRSAGTRAGGCLPPAVTRSALQSASRAARWSGSAPGRSRCSPSPRPSGSPETQ